MLNWEKYGRPPLSADLIKSHNYELSTSNSDWPSVASHPSTSRNSNQLYTRRTQKLFRCGYPQDLFMQPKSFSHHTHHHKSLLFSHPQQPCSFVHSISLRSIPFTHSQSSFLLPLLIPTPQKNLSLHLTTQDLISSHKVFTQHTQKHIPRLPLPTYSSLVHSLIR